MPSLNKVDEVNALVEVGFVSLSVCFISEVNRRILIKFGFRDIH